MMWQRPAIITRRSALAAALAAGLSASLSTSASDDGLERAQLAAILRQIDMLERHSALCAQNGSRYGFDYARLHADLSRIRAGHQPFHVASNRSAAAAPCALSGMGARLIAAAFKNLRRVVWLDM
jgi:RAQPRD family integrative conjugative element protein